MRVLYDREGNPFDVPDDKVQDAVTSGGYFFLKGETVPVLSPDRKPFNIPSNEAYQALQRGWSFEGPDQEKGRLEEEHYGSLKEVGKLAAESFAGEATFGLSRMAEAALLGNEAEQAARARVNPAIRIGAGIAGAVLPTLLSRGKSTPAAIARLTPAGMAARAFAPAAGAGLATRAGLAAGETALYGAGTELTEATLGDRPVSAQKLLSDATLGGLFGGGTTGVLGLAGAVSKQGLAKMGAQFRRAPVTAAEAFERGTLEAATSSIARRAETDPTTFVGKVLDEMVGKDTRAAWGRLAKDEGWLKLARTEASDVDRLAIEGAEVFQGFTTTIKGAADRLRKTVKPAEVAEGLKAVNPLTLRKAIADVATQIRATAKAMHASPEEFFDAPQIEQLLTQAKGLEKRAGLRLLKAADGTEQLVLRTKVDPSAQELYDALDMAKGKLGVIAKVHETQPATQRAAAARATDIGVTIKELLENQTLVGSAGAAQAKYNRLTSEHMDAADDLWKSFGVRDGFQAGRPTSVIDPKDFQKYFNTIGKPESELSRKALERYLRSAKDVADLSDDPLVKQKLLSTFERTEDMARLGKAMGDLKRIGGGAEQAAQHLGRLGAQSVIGGAVGALAGGPLGAAAGALTAPYVGRAVLRLMERVITQRTRTVKGLASAIAQGKRPPGRPVMISTFKILEAMRFSDRSYEKPPKNSREAYARVRADLTQINEDQEGARGRVASRLEGVASEAPELAVEAAEHGMRKALYLFANMPVEAKVGKLQRGVSGGPSDSDIDSFARLARAVNNPVTVLEDILARRLSTEGAKGARETDVQLVEEMKAEILTAVDENGTTPNYETRLQLSLLFGEPMDPTLEPRFVKAMQETYAVEADEKSLTQPLKSTRDLKSISAAASAMQRLESAGPA